MVFKSMRILQHLSMLLHEQGIKPIRILSLRQQVDRLQA